MNIVVLLGTSRYDVTREFAQLYAEGFSELGHKVYVWDLPKSAVWPFDNNFNIDVIFSINGASPGFTGTGLYKFYDHIPVDLSKTIYVWFHVDHPLYNLNRLSVKLKNLIVLYVDKSLSKFTTNVWECEISADGFLPHAGVQYKSFALRRPKKDIDILFTSTASEKPEREKIFPDEVRRDYLLQNFTKTNELKNAKEVISFIQDAIDFHSINMQSNTLWCSVYELAKSKNYEIMQWDKYYLRQLLIVIDGYLRSYIKYDLLKFAVDTGFKVHVYGEGWENHSLSRQLYGKKEVKFSEIPFLNAKAKIALNCNGNFIHGSHERFFNAMINGAIPLTYTSSYYLEEFANCFITKNDVHKIKRILTDEEYFSEFSDKIRFIAEAKHSWFNRAKSVIAFVNEYKEFTGIG